MPDTEHANATTCSDPNQLAFGLDDVRPARARATDPPESKAAARIVEPGNSELCRAIRLVVKVNGPGTQRAIARWVEAAHPMRWQNDTIRTAVKRAGLRRQGALRYGGRLYGIYGL